MDSKSFSSQIRPAGQQYRTGVLGEAITETYKDTDAAFKLLETSSGYGFTPCRLAFSTEAETTFAGSAPDAVDGVTTAVGDRILVTAQTTASKNGIYVVTDLGAGVDDATWARANDLNATAEVGLGYKVRVLYGTVHACTDWQVTAAPAVLGANTLTFSKITTALSAAAARTLVKALTEGNFDDLAAAGVIDGDRLKADGLTAANLKAALAVDSLDFSDPDIAAAVKAGTLPASKFAAGSATEGLNGGDVKFTAAQVAGALAVATVPVVLALTIPDAASGFNDFTGLVGKHRVIDAWFITEAGAHADNSYQIINGTGANVLNLATKPSSVNAGSITRFSGLDATHRVLADASTIRVTHVKVGNSSAATLYLMLVPEA
jgi:hypothetical protein